MDIIKKTWAFLDSYIFQFFAVVLLFSLPFSESLLSISSALIFSLALFPFFMKTKFDVLKHDKQLWALVAVFFIYVVGLIFCTDWKTGAYEVQKIVFWLLLPIGVAMSRKIKEKEFWLLLFLFVVFVFAASLIVAFKIIYPQKFGITDVRYASFINHAVFSFQIVFSFFIVAFSFIKQAGIINKIHPVIRIALMLWLLFFLLFQKSLLGFLVLYVSSIYFVLANLKKVGQKWLRITAVASVVVIIWLPVNYFLYVYNNFNKVLDIKPQKETSYTKQGNVYTFDFRNPQKENGHFVHWYICEPELEAAWNSRSETKLYEKGETGYRIYDTLIRYLTSKGLKKDAEGIEQLSNADIENVTKGVANIIYIEKKYSLYPRVYETIWEYNHYKTTGDPNNQSLSQRFEYTKAALYLIKKYPWGIGTGNFKQKFAEAYSAISTPLDKELWVSVHNQYLSYMVKFGALGLVLIFSLLFYAVNAKKQFKNKLLVILLIIVSISNLGDAIMETHMGLSFFLFFLSLFLWHSPKTITSD